MLSLESLRKLYNKIWPWAIQYMHEPTISNKNNICYDTAARYVQMIIVMKNHIHECWSNPLLICGNCSKDGNINRSLCCCEMLEISDEWFNGIYNYFISFLVWSVKIPCVTNFTSLMLYFSVKIYWTLKIKIIQKQNKTFSRNFLHMYKFIPSGNRFSIILSNRTSDYARGTRGLFITSFIKLKNHRRCFH